MAFKGRMRFNSSFNVNRVVKRLVKSILALYVGGIIMTVFGQVMTCTYSPFYTGLSLIGWTVSSANSSTAVNYVDAGGVMKNCTSLSSGDLTPNVITSSTGSGVLAVVGIIAIAQIVTEFVTW